MTSEDRELLRIAVDAAQRRRHAEQRALMSAACACQVCHGAKRGVVAHGIYAYALYKCRCPVCRAAKADAIGTVNHGISVRWEQLELKATA